MTVASFNFGWVVGRGATSPDKAINLGRHSENISVVDGTRENVHFDARKDEKFSKVVHGLD